MTLTKGSRGELVKRLQKALHLIEDGIYGSVTEDAVKAFQKANGLKEDGIAGEKTLKLLFANEMALKVSRRNINKIIVHCTATPEGMDYTVEKIRAQHKAQGWSDIGYHYVIYRDGTIHDGRSVDLVGSHCVGHNANSIGVCYVGGCDKKMKPKDTRTDEQKDALVKLLKDLRKKYPKAKIYGHRDFSSKECPSFDAKEEYKNI